MKAWTRFRDSVFVFALIFTALFLSHTPLLRLPYFWDEAGYYIPAAHDLLLTGSLIPHSTMSNAHPPLVMLWLAFWWKFSAFTPAVTRTSLLLVAAFALLGVWNLARAVSTRSVALATVLCTACYPVFFTQSSLAHLDMMSAALTIWGLVAYVRGKFWTSVAWFALAPLAKETAIVTPLALFGWELLCPLLPFKVVDEPVCLNADRGYKKAGLLLCLLPLAAWFLYHRHVTGYLLGNPDYLRYNLGATLTPLRAVLAFLIRLWQLFGYLNLFILTLGMVYAMCGPALLEDDGSTRPRIPVNVQFVLLAMILANLLLLSVAGGAELARYLLPVYPLVILLCVSTLRRRVRRWAWWIAAACAGFVFALLTPPPYRVAPEDTLLYRDYVLLHKRAADTITARFPQARILTAWPASDELTRPYLGFVKQPLEVVRIENFSEPEILRAAQATDQFDVAFLFSTKWVPPNPLLRSLPFGKARHQRYFDFHEDVTPDLAAQQLGGRVVQYWNRQNEWVAIVRLEKIENAVLH